MLRITRWREGGREGGNGEEGREGGREWGGREGGREGMGREGGREGGEMCDKSNGWRYTNVYMEGLHKNTLSHMTKHMLVQTESYTTPKYQAF